MSLSLILPTLLLAPLLVLVSAVAVRAMIARPILDHPAARKMHDRPTPKGGGVGPVLAFVLGMLVLFNFIPPSPMADGRYVGVILAAVAIAAVALADDVRDFRFLVNWPRRPWPRWWRWARGWSCTPCPCPGSAPCRWACWGWPSPCSGSWAAPMP